MTDLVCVAFDDRNNADQALNKLQSLQKEYLIDLADAVVVLRDKDGKVRLKQSVNLAASGAATGGVSGAFWGTLIGLLFLNPLAGLLIGAAAGAGSGALFGALSDYGIDDDFIRGLGNTIKPDSSALFLLIRDVKADRVMEELEGLRGTVLKTSLSREQEKKLREFLANNRETILDAAA